MSKTSSYKITICILSILIFGLLFYLSRTYVGTKKINLGNRQTKLQVATSFYPLYFFTTQIAQDKADVYNLTPAGAEPHDYEPTTKDMVLIENSQLVIINGGKLEAWADNLNISLDKQKTTILNVGDNLMNQNVIDNDSTKDPHVWLNPVLAQKMVETITANLITIDPKNSQFYTNNAKILIEQLENLNNQFKIGLGHCVNRDIITSHAAFGYLAAEYHLNQVAISGLSPDAEPSPKKLAEISKFAQQNKIQYIFFESLVSPKLADTIAKEIGVSTLVLNPIEGLTNEEIKNGKNYFTEMQNNLTNLKIALQCQ